MVESVKILEDDGTSGVHWKTGATMTITLELPKELERTLIAEAARRGLSVEQYALRRLEDEPSSQARPSNGAELVAYWRREGVLGSRPDIRDSQAHAREIRRQAESRSRS